MVFSKIKKKSSSEGANRDEDNHTDIPWELPKWAPKQLRDRFVYSLTNILRYCLQEFDLKGKSAHQQIETWSKSFIALQCPPSIRQRFKVVEEFKKNSIPPEVVLELGILIYAKLIVDLGKTEGLEAHLGSEGEKILWEIIFSGKRE